MPKTNRKCGAAVRSSRIVRAQVPKYTGPFYVSKSIAHKAVTKMIEAVIVTGRVREFVDGDWQEEELQQIEAMVDQILDEHVAQYTKRPNGELCNAADRSDGAQQQETK